MNQLEEFIRSLKRIERQLRWRERQIISGPAARVKVYNNASFTHDSSGNWLDITFNSEVEDTHGFHSTVSNTERLTVPTGQDGNYIIIGYFSFAANSTGARQLRIQLNGTTNIAYDNNTAPSASYRCQLAGFTQIPLVAGNYITLRGWQNSGGSLDISYTARTTPYLMMTRIP